MPRTMLPNPVTKKTDDGVRTFRWKLSLAEEAIKLYYIEQPTPELVQSFTALKGELWSKIKSDIDNYILRALLEEIEVGAGTDANIIDLIQSEMFSRWLRAAVFNDINFGLCAIGFRPRNAFVQTAAPEVASRTREDSFSSALSDCLSRSFDIDGRRLRKAKSQCQAWLDACIWHAAEKSYKIAKKLNNPEVAGGQAT